MVKMNTPNKVDSFVEELSTEHRPGQTQQLHLIDGNYYIVSKVQLPNTWDGDWETMIFRSNEYGEVESMSEVYSYTGSEPIAQSIYKFTEQLRQQHRNQ